MPGETIERPAAGSVDRADLVFVLALGAVMATLKTAQITQPEWGISRHTHDTLASAIVLVYVIARARRAPQKLDEWGITTPLSFAGLAMSGVMLLAAVATLAMGGIRLAGSVSFEAALVPQMVEYLFAAFPQQFVLCSVVLAALGTLPLLRGHWRLPLAAGLAFSLAHFWTPVRIPGTFIPVQMVLTFPAGFAVAAYFLRFRSILPLTVIHAVVYPLLNNWIEKHL